jgi:type II secretion system protein N
MRRLLPVLAGGLVFGVTLAALFPTDAVVRRVLARATPAGWPGVVFARAALRPRGIVLDDVTLRDSTGRALARAEQVRVLPSLWSLVRGGSGLPCRIEASACGGTGEATLEDDGAATAIVLAWQDADLAACPPLVIAGGALAGRARGAARLRLDPAAAPEGTGDVELSAAVWRGTGLFASLHADSASVRWRLQDGRLALEALDLHGPDVTVNGSGEVRLAAPFEESALAIRLALRAGGPLRRFDVVGTVARPEVVSQ